MPKKREQYVYPLRLKPELSKDLKEVCDKHGVSMHKIIETGTKEIVSKLKGKKALFEFENV